MRHTSVRRRAAVALATAACALTLAAPLLAHDFWLIPNAFEIAAGARLDVRGQTSSAFPTSLSAITPDRIAEAKILSAAGEVPLGDFSRTGTSFVVRHRPATAGQQVVAVALASRLVRESPESFRRYLVLEGAPEALERYEREGRMPTRDSVTRRYAKYAKTVVQVGRGGARAYTRVAGHPLEFVPLSDPGALRAGDSLSVRVLHRGRPLASAHVHAGAAAPGAASLTDTAAARRAAAADVALVTGPDGVVRLPVGRPGLWNLRMLHIVPADSGPGADWDVHWATLVFRVSGRTGVTRPAR